MLRDEILSLTFFLFVASVAAHAQQYANVPSHKLWIEVGAGGGPGYKSFLGSANASVTYLAPHNIPIRVKGAYHEGLGLRTNFAQNQRDIGLLSGIVLPIRQSAIEFYAGLGIASGQRFGEPDPNGFLTGDELLSYEKVKYHKIPTLPFEIRWNWRWFGLGVDTNINKQFFYTSFNCYARLGLIKRTPAEISNLPRQ